MTECCFLFLCDVLKSLLKQGKTHVNFFMTIFPEHWYPLDILSTRDVVSAISLQLQLFCLFYCFEIGWSDSWANNDATRKSRTMNSRDWKSSFSVAYICNHALFKKVLVLVYEQISGSINILRLCSVRTVWWNSKHCDVIFFQ